MHPGLGNFLLASTVSSKCLHGQAQIRRSEQPTLPRTMPLPTNISFFKMFFVHSDAINVFKFTGSLLVDPDIVNKMIIFDL